MTCDVLLVAKLATMPVVIPRITLPQGVRKPEQGVAATSPEMVPEHQPTIDHLRARRQSRRTQVIAANMAVRLEFQHAMTARRLAPKAEPPLKPNHPNHRKTVPRVMSETLCGRKLRSSFSPLRPRTQEYARPATPLPISTGPPPKWAFCRKWGYQSEEEEGETDRRNRGHPTRTPSRERTRPSRRAGSRQSSSK